MRGIAFARKLRKESTDAERLLWYYLRAGHLYGRRFRRQHPIGPYVADFACVAERLVIELDGSQHANQSRYDDERTARLRQRGWRVVRFRDDEVLLEIDAVLEHILALLAMPLTPTLSPRRGERGQD